MHLRAATLDDIDTLLRHRREMFREMGGHYAADLDRMEPASREYFRTAIAAGTYHGILLELKDASVIAGGGVVIAAWPGSVHNVQARRAWILNIFVEPEHRRQGHARHITQSLIDWCRTQGFGSVALHASEYGRSLYEQMGFRPTNEMRLSLK